MGGVIIGSEMLSIGKEAEMSGAISGSEIGLIAKESEDRVADWQRRLAVSVNTGCTLACPQCYLGTKDGNRTMDLETARWIAELPCAGLVAVATEPLLNNASVEVVELMARIAPRMRIITNGLNLEQSAHLITALEAVDISLDGGPRFYDRSPNFECIVAGARRWQEVSGGKEVYALHTLTRENCQPERISDMLEGSRAIGARASFFSPFIPTLGGGDRSLLIPTEEIVKCLLPFQGQGEWFLVSDIMHAMAEWRFWSEIKDTMSALRPEHRLIVDADPGDWVVRVDVDGRFHHPLVAAHPGLGVPGRRLF